MALAEESFHASSDCFWVGWPAPASWHFVTLHITAGNRMKSTTTVNQSLMANRRCQIPSGVEVVIGRRGRASILLQASVAYLHRSTIPA